MIILNLLHFTRSWNKWTHRPGYTETLTAHVGVPSVREIVSITDSPSGVISNTSRDCSPGHAQICVCRVCMHKAARARVNSLYCIADVFAVTTQSTDFAPIEETLTSALVGQSENYTTNQLRANPTKTQVSLLNLRNRECRKQFNISWNGVNLTHCNLPVYPGVALDRTLSYKAHIEKTKNKVGTRNNIIRKLRNSKWGHSNHTQVIRPSAILLSCRVCLPGVGALHPCKETERDTGWNLSNDQGCLKPTNTNSLPVLAGIAPSDITRAVASRTERTRQTTDERHPLNGYLGMVPRLKSGKSFIKCTELINTTAKAARIELRR